MHTGSRAVEFAGATGLSLVVCILHAGMVLVVFHYILQGSHGNFLSGTFTAMFTIYLPTDRCCLEQHQC